MPAAVMQASQLLPATELMLTRKASKLPANLHSHRNLGDRCGSSNAIRRSTSSDSQYTIKTATSPLNSCLLFLYPSLFHPALLYPSRSYSSLLYFLVYPSLLYATLLSSTSTLLGSTLRPLLLHLLYPTLPLLYFFSAFHRCPQLGTMIFALVSMGLNDFSTQVPTGHYDFGNSASVSL